MKKEIISIVLPVYNVEKYLNECVQSILGQTFGDFELIVVDDGSTDGCSALCDEYARRDERVRVLHKANGGLSDARNAGIEMAQGDYITFIDSDDVVSPYYLSHLYYALRDTGAQLSQCVFTRKKDKLLLADASEKPAEVLCLSKEKAFRNYLRRKNLYVAACGKLYDRALFDGIRFPVGYLNEDNFTTYKLIYKAQASACLREPLYWHRITQGSIMRSAFSQKKLQVRTVPQEMQRYLGTESACYAKELDYYRFRLNISVYNRMLGQSRDDEFLEEKNQIQKEIFAFGLENIPEAKFKLVWLMLRWGRPIYAGLIKALCRKGMIS